MSTARCCRCYSAAPRQDVAGGNEVELTTTRRSKRMRVQERKNLADRDDSASEADLQDDELEVY